MRLAAAIVVAGAVALPPGAFAEDCPFPQMDAYGSALGESSAALTAFIGKHKDWCECKRGDWKHDADGQPRCFVKGTNRLMPQTDEAGPTAPSSSDEALAKAAGYIVAGGEVTPDVAALIGLNLGMSLGSSLDAAAKKAEAKRLLELEAVRQAALAREAVAANEAVNARKHHEEVVSGMKSSSGGSLQLKSISDEALSASAGAVFDGKPLPDPDASVVDLRGRTSDSVTLLRTQEPSRPYADCAATRAARSRLAAGLPVLDESIQRTRAQLDAASKNALVKSTEAREKLFEEGLDQLREAATGAIGSARALRKRVEWMRQSGMSRADRREWLERLDRIDDFAGDIEETAEQIESEIKAGKATIDYAKRLSAAAGDLGKIMQAAYQFSLESGLLEEVGAELASAGGPFGELAFRLANLGIEIGLIAAESKLSADEAAKARGQLETMISSRARIQDQIATLEGRAADAKCPP